MFSVARDGVRIVEEANEVVLLDVARIVYRPEAPLYPGSHIVAWIETHGAVEADGERIV